VPAMLHRLRAVALSLPVLLAACSTHAGPRTGSLPDPHVTMPDGRLYTAALACAARRYAWVARTGSRSPEGRLRHRQPLEIQRRVPATVTRRPAPTTQRTDRSSSHG
jgi:hypothetical protein